MGDSATYDFVLSVDLLEVLGHFQGAVRAGVVNNNHFIVQLAVGQLANTRNSEMKAKWTRSGSRR